MAGALPLQTGAFDTPLDRRMFGALTDVAPDQWGRRVIQRAAERGLTADDSLSEYDFIIGARDDMRQGNLRFRSAEDGAFVAASESCRCRRRRVFVHCQVPACIY